MRKNLIAALCFFVALPTAPITAQSCQPADSLSSDMIDELNSLMAPTDTVVRGSLQLPSVATSQIALVTDQTVCMRAWQAVDSTVRATNPSAPANSAPRPLYVVTVGTYWAVVDPRAHVGEWFPMYFFDPAWKYLNMLGGWR
jgi:hypothetical protein